jgi:transcriptional regulator with XRE-family HTH domain
VRKPVSGTSAIPPQPRLVAAARVLIGLSQRELAAAAGVAIASIARYEAGTSTLRSNSFAAILTVFRAHGVRFVEETEEIAMGVLLLKEKLDTASSQKL